MSELAIGLLGGIILGSAFALFSMLAMDNNKEGLAVLFSGPVTWIVMAVLKCINECRTITHHMLYKSAMLDPYGNPCYCSPRETPDALLTIGYKWNEGIRQKYIQKNGWRKADCSMNTVNLRYTPIKVIKNEKMYRIQKSVLKTALKKYTSEEF